MLDTITGSTDLRDWVGTLVCPLTDHLAASAPQLVPRFAAQAMADPTTAIIVTKDALTSPQLVHAMKRINQRLPDLPDGFALNGLRWRATC